MSSPVPTGGGALTPSTERRTPDIGSDGKELNIDRDGESGNNNGRNSVDEAGRIMRTDAMDVDDDTPSEDTTRATVVPTMTPHRSSPITPQQQVRTTGFRVRCV